jgi:hypothetical protein
VHRAADRPRRRPIPDYINKGTGTIDSRTACDKAALGINRRLLRMVHPDVDWPARAGEKNGRELKSRVSMFELRHLFGYFWRLNKFACHGCRITDIVNMS